MFFLIKLTIIIVVAVLLTTLLPGWLVALGLLLLIWLTLGIKTSKKESK